MSKSGNTDMHMIPIGTRKGIEKRSKNKCEYYSSGLDKCNCKACPRYVLDCRSTDCDYYKEI